MCLPDDHVDQMHNGFIQAFKKIPQRFCFIPHAAQDEAKGDRKKQ